MSAYLRDKASVKDVVAKLTLREKARLLTGATMFSSCGMEKYGIPAIRYLDCASGINLMQYYMEGFSQLAGEKNRRVTDSDETREGTGAMLAVMEDFEAVKELMRKGLHAEDLSPLSQQCACFMQDKMPNGKLPTCFPNGMMLGASWSPKLVYQLGEAAGKEAASYKIDILLGSPNVNIHRDPLNGRLFEGLSEDPCLVSRLAPELIKGVQNQGVGADVKHYAANNQETLRMGINEHISERALHEIYFPGFKASVTDGKAMTVMSAYNSINGVPCALNKWLLTDVLRDEWGFEGFVVSDWGAAYNQAQALAAGNDMDMPGPRPIKPILDAVRNGDLKEETLDCACERFLSAVVDIIEYRKRRVSDFSIEESTRAAYDLAADSITLLKNDGALPLAKGAVVSFFGDKSKAFLASGEGSALVITDRFTSMLEEVGVITGKNNITFGKVADDADLVVITGSKTSAEGFDHLDMELPPGEKAMVLATIKEAKAKGKKVLFVLNSSGPVETKDFIDDIDAMLWVYYPGQEGGKAAARMIFGEINPSGKLPLTYPKRYKDCPTCGNFPGSCGEVWYGEGIFVGYRWYDFKDIEPLFPFGFGLSYTTFEITDIRLSSEKMNLDVDESIRVSVKVRNSGKFAGKEVVQVYIADEVSTLPKPVKELKAFKKLLLAPGEERTVEFDFTKSCLASYDTAYGKWETEPGWYKVLIGSSSRDIACEGRFRAYGHSVYDFGANTQMIKMMNSDEAKAVLAKHLQEHMSVELVMSSLSFTPYLDFRTVWDNIIASRITKNSEDTEKLFAAVCKSLADIDIGEK